MDSANGTTLDHVQYLEETTPDSDDKVYLQGWVGCKTKSNQKQEVWTRSTCGTTFPGTTTRCSIKPPWDNHRLLPQISVSGIRTSNRWHCSFCQGIWHAGRQSTQLVTISWDNYQVQLIMDQPPFALYNSWCKEREEYYAIMEPEDPPPLEYVSAIVRSGTRQVTLKGSDSDMVWRAIFSVNPVQAIHDWNEASARHGMGLSNRP